MSEGGSVIRREGAVLLMWRPRRDARERLLGRSTRTWPRCPALAWAEAGSLSGSCRRRRREQRMDATLGAALAGAGKNSPGRIAMSDCLHCDIIELVRERLEGGDADLSDMTAMMVEALAEVILLAP